MNIVKCEICLKLFKGLAGHLKSKHGISTKEYKLLYPNSLTLSEDFYKKIANKKIKKCIVCGINFSPKDPRTITCSKKCRYEHTTKLKIGKIRSENYISVYCKNCGKKDILKKYNDMNHFCNRICYDKFHSAVKHKIKCKYQMCQNIIEIYDAQIEKKKYCSRDCYKLDYNEARQDFNGNSRYKKGYYISIRNNTKIWYDSSWKLSRMKQIDMDINVEKWSKNKIKIKYLGEDNQYHIYTPDLLINYKNGTTIIEEIKGRISKKDVLKMEAAIPYLKNINIEYKLIQKYDIYNDYIEPIIEDYENKFGKFQRISLLSSLIKMTYDISDRSTCIRRKVGCIISPSDFTNVSSIGYNGSLPGEENGCKSIIPSKCGCIHAEINALQKFTNYDPKKSYTLISTLSPCLNCAKEILNYPINKVVYLHSYRDTYGIKFLRENNIEVLKYDDIVKTSNNRYDKISI